MYIKLIYLINFMVFLGIMTYLSYIYGIYFCVKHYKKTLLHTTFTVFSIIGTIFFTILFGMMFFIPV